MVDDSGALWMLTRQILRRFGIRCTPRHCLEMWILGALCKYILTYLLSVPDFRQSDHCLCSLLIYLCSPLVNFRKWVPTYLIVNFDFP